MATVEEAQAAMDGLNGLMVLGRKLNTAGVLAVKKSIHYLGNVSIEQVTFDCNMSVTLENILQKQPELNEPYIPTGCTSEPFYTAQRKAKTGTRKVELDFKLPFVNLSALEHFIERPQRAQMTQSQYQDSSRFVNKNKSFEYGVNPPLHVAASNKIVNHTGKPVVVHVNKHYNPQKQHQQFVYVQSMVNQTAEEMDLAHSAQPAPYYNEFGLFVAPPPVTQEQVIQQRLQRRYQNNEQHQQHAPQYGDERPFVEQSDQHFNNQTSPTNFQQTSARTIPQQQQMQMPPAPPPTRSLQNITRQQEELRRNMSMMRQQSVPPRPQQHQQVQYAQHPSPQSFQQRQQHQQQLLQQFPGQYSANTLTPSQRQQQAMHRRAIMEEQQMQQSPGYRQEWAGEYNTAQQQHRAQFQQPQQQRPPVVHPQMMSQQVNSLQYADEASHYGPSSKQLDQSVMQLHQQPAQSRASPRVHIPVITKAQHDSDDEGEDVQLRGFQPQRGAGRQQQQQSTRGGGQSSAFDFSFGGGTIGTGPGGSFDLLLGGLSSDLSRASLEPLSSHEWDSLTDQGRLGVPVFEEE
eukprot:gene32175-39732_t